jgi:hypothetical protein
VDRAGLLAIGGHRHDWIVDVAILEGHLEAEGAIGVELDGLATNGDGRIGLGSTVNDQFGIGNQPELAGTNWRCRSREA